MLYFSTYHPNNIANIWNFVYSVKNHQKTKSLVTQLAIKDVESCTGCTDKSA